jgi:exosortase family protein XrtF
LNIGRIALLCIALYDFPQMEHILHGVIFPLVIYGVVFLLWVIWVNKYSNHATATTKK